MFVEMCNSIYEYIKQNPDVTELSPYGIFNSWSSTVSSVDDSHLEDFVSYIADVVKIIRSEVANIL